MCLSRNSYRCAGRGGAARRLVCYCVRIRTHMMESQSAMALARTNLTLPEELMREVDELAGPRGRSRYVAEAVAQRVKRDRLGKALRESFGSMTGKPGAMSPDEVVAFVDALRSEETD